MNHDLNPYPEYKDSGVPWLGQVPRHWIIKPLKRWVKINAEVLPETTSEDYEFRYLDIGAVGIGTLNEPPQRMRFANAPSRARRVLKQGDTIVSTVRTYLKAVYFISTNTNDLIASTGFAVLTPGVEVEPKYLSYVVQSNSFTDRVSANSVGIAYPAIAETKLGTFQVALPPVEEQSAIVRYLDYVDRRIRRYIHAKKKLIALLNEQKQVIIHRAVTRGLDPNVRLKPSGVEWLGDVPEHWDVRPAKRYYREVDERSPAGAGELLSVSHITGVTPRSQKAVTMFMAESYVGHKLCRAGDLVINTMWAWMAALGVAKQDGIVSPSYAVYRPFSPSAFLPQFTDWILRTRPYVAEYICRSTGIRSSRLRLYPEQFLRIPLVCPPISEQQEIIEYVDKTARDLDRALNQADCEISLIRAYRARLIADVVTGKLDVREAAANLLEAPEAGEPEPEGTDPLDMDAPFEPDESSDQDEREAGAVEVSDE